MTDLIIAIRKNELDFDSSIEAYSVGEENKVFVQFQDRERHFIEFKRTHTPRVSSQTWARIWINGECVFNNDFPKYVARQKVIEFLEGVSNGNE